MKLLKKPLSIACFLFLLTGLQKSFSQPEKLIKFHPPTTDELNFKECPYDKDATAIILMHQGITQNSITYEMETYHYVRLKILKDKGIEHGTISIPYYRDDGFEFITDIKGRIYDGYNYTELDKKSVYQKNLNKFWGEYKFTFPNLKAGSIIEYSYQSTMKHYGGLREWVFQEEIPVQESNYDLTLIPNSEFSYVVYKSPNLKIDIKPDNLNGKITFDMVNIPGLIQEPYIDSRKDYLQKVAFQLSKFQNVRYSDSWYKVNDEMASEQYFYHQLKRDLPGTENFIKETKQLNSAYDKMKKVYDFVRNSITWNGINSKYSTDGIRQAWDKKTGTSGDINLILVNLLKSADLDAEPVLVSEREHGKVHTNFISVDQFNTVYACVNIDNKYHYLDATDKYTAPYLIPYSLLNTTAFIVRKKKGELIEITDTATSYKQSISVNGTQDENGQVTGEFFINSYDYARMREQYRYDNNGTSSYEKRITGNTPGLNISNLSISSDSDERKSFQAKGNFNISSSSSGDYHFLPYNLFTGFTENPFTSNNRFSNINFGYRQSFSFFIHLKLNEKFTINEVPKSLKLSNEGKDISFTRVVFEDKENNEIAIRANIEITKGLYEFWQYDNLKDYYKKLFNYLSEQIVLKKK